MFLDLFKEFAIHDMEVTSSVPLGKALIAELKSNLNSKAHIKLKL